MDETPYDQIDGLFVQIRLRLLKVRESDPTTAEELKSLLTQLETCIESEFIRYLKFKSQESKQKTAKVAKERRQKKIGTQ
jgi:D-ribose pyranose/furanose isomerase RbsD